MPIPQIQTQQLYEAMRKFDAELRHTPRWERWDSNRAQQYALEHEGQLYPPKEIISLATGLPVSDFSGGSESNNFLAGHGLTVRRLRDQSLGEVFQLILERYGDARKNLSFGGNHEIKELFAQARTVLQQWPAVKQEHLEVVSSYGKGRWATVPWIAILDDRETRTTQRGTYVVYLFEAEGKGVYLKLAQGVTQLANELGMSGALEQLAQDANAMRGQVGGLRQDGFDLSGQTDLGTTQALGRLYESSTIASKFYPRDAIPSDDQLKQDVSVLLTAYQGLVSGASRAPFEDTRKLALVGTWREVLSGFEEVDQAVRQRGAWASWWSFPIDEEAVPRLRAPFNLYIHKGNRQIAAKLRIDDFKTSRGNDGIPSPWPEVTPAQWQNLTRGGPRQSDAFKTWFKVGSIALIDPPRMIEDFELAVGLSKPTNVLNQNRFGYVYDEDAAAAPEETPELADVPAGYDLQWLQTQSGLSLQVLQEIVDSLLGRAPQVILAGPPGTSKTWLARLLALYAARGVQDQIRFVQFHPSYTYESFVEGLRPVARDGTVSFALTPGLVVEAVNEMKTKQLTNVPGREFVVVMDELNRANLPRVLGELMFLFEYRNESARLQYSGTFSLPTNLRFIGTMNTADRSIRSIDAALRRRFDVFELQPDANILRRHFKDADSAAVEALVTGFQALNAQLTTQIDRHHTIGHAFFMLPQLDGAALRKVWARKVFPLIEEFMFDQPDALAAFTYETFWPGL